MVAGVGAAHCPLTPAPEDRDLRNAARVSSAISTWIYRWCHCFCHGSVILKREKNGGFVAVVCFITHIFSMRSRPITGGWGGGKKRKYKERKNYKG